MPTIIEVTDAMVEKANDWSRKKYGRPVGTRDLRECLEAALAVDEPTDNELASTPGGIR